MKKDAKVEMTAAWWKKNKAVTLRDKGKLDKALKEYEKATGGVKIAKAKMRYQLLGIAVKKLEAIKEAAAKNAKACGPLHQETKHVLENQFLDKANALIKEHQADQDKVIKEAGELKIKKILTDRTWRVLFQQYAKERYVAENINFLIETTVNKKLTQATYHEFIREGASQQINIDYDLRIVFDNAFANGAKPDKQAWSNAIVEISKLITNNDLGKARGFVRWIKS